MSFGIFQADVEEIFTLPECFEKTFYLMGSVFAGL